MFGLAQFEQLAVAAVPILFAITWHEVAHGFLADFLGDDSARLSGRLRLNPLAHLDPWGTIVVPLIMMATTGFVFGWAKPLPVTAAKLQHPRRDMSWVALAGPGANLLMALLWGLVGLAATAGRGVLPLGLDRMLLEMGAVGILANGVLLALNLLPVPPLDGGRVLIAVLPEKAAAVMRRLEPYGLFLLIALFLTGAFSGLLSVPVSGIINAIQRFYS